MKSVSFPGKIGMESTFFGEPVEARSCSGHGTEEFVEIYSIYVTSTVAEWDEIMGSIRNPNGRSLIGRKLQMVRDYFTNSYGLDMDKMRESVVSAIKEVTEGNLD